MPNDARSTPPLPLWQILLAELRLLRPDCTQLGGAAIERLERSDAADGGNAEQLPKLFRIIHSWTARPAPLAALCFSGGGIRSATFNLGVLQGLARLGLLSRFDYLSSVSGGGYIAGWLARWLREDGLTTVVKKLTARPADPATPEPLPVTHLRQYSNYLTPRLGVLSADTWTLVAIFLRNLVLNWAVLLPLLAAPLLVPLLAVATPLRLSHPRALLLAAAALELTGLFFVSLLRASGQKGAGEPQPRWAQWYLRLGLLPRLAAVPLLLAGVATFAGSLAQLPAAQRYGYCAAWAFGLPLLALVASALLQQKLLHRKTSLLAWDLIALLVAGAIDTAIYAALLVGALPALLASKLPLYAILGPCLVLGTMLAGRIAFVAMSSIAEHWQSVEYGDPEREWWARWSAWTLIALVVWMAGSALVLFAPTLLATTAAQLAALLSAGGFGAVAALLGRSRSTPAANDAEPGLAKKLLLAVAAPLFAVGLILVLSWGSQQLLQRIWPAIHAAAAAHTSVWRYVPPYSGVPSHVLLAIAALLLIGVAASYPVNVNRFSLQAGYRNRLIRAYLGASNPARNPNPFTGFDPNDNVLLSGLAGNRPFPVINMALNLVHGDDLAWQERKAESFTATPLHCGASRLGYRPTGDYGGKQGLSLGTAVATSGAAANPNMGRSSSPALGFIMALFNVRLGIWLGNPKTTGRMATYGRSGPRFSVRVLIDEALGWTDDQHPYVNLSDGGHFEDLGLYEMVRRRCRTIFVSDAGADPKFAFDDLGNAIRKIRIDFGIRIEFKDRVRIYPKQASGQPADKARYCAVAKIHYEEVDENGVTGTLVYIKPSICEDSPFDVDTYARASPLFPHEPTADQWFSETQFESYRALGEAAAEAMAFLEPPDSPRQAPPADLDAYVARIKDYLEEEKARGTATTVGADARPPGQGVS